MDFISRNFQHSNCIDEIKEWNSNSVTCDTWIPCSRNACLGKSSLLEKMFHKSLDFPVGVLQGWWYVPFKHRRIMAWASPTIHSMVMFKTHEFCLSLIKEGTKKHCIRIIRIWWVSNWDSKWSFPVIGVLPIHFDGIFPYKPSSYWGTSIYGTTSAGTSRLTAVRLAGSFWWWRASAPGVRPFGISIAGWGNAMHRISWWCRLYGWRTGLICLMHIASCYYMLLWQYMY